MGLHTRLPDYDAIFKSLNNSILLNEVPYVTKEDRVLFNSLLITKTETDVLCSVPTCECGKYTYGYNEGRVCDNCNTTVQLQNESIIDTKVWIQCPEGVHGFISPFLWIKLKHLTANSGYNILLWAIDPKSVPRPRKPTKLVKLRIDALERAGWQRSLNYFIEHWEAYFIIMAETLVGKAKAKMYSELDLLSKNKAMFFPKYLPVPTKALMVIEKTNLGNYADTSTMSYAVAAAKTIGVISMPRNPPMKPLSVKYLESKIVGVCENLTIYSANTFKKNICPKSGWLRGHVYRARSDFTGRAVITSIPTPHWYAELHLPWTMGVEIFKFHIINILRNKYEYSRKEYTTLLNYAGSNYDPIIDDILQSLIASGEKLPRRIKFDEGFHRWRGLTTEQINQIRLPEHGICSAFQRNPTLGLGSMQRLYVTKFKTDLTDKSISMSDLIAAAFNADHDI
jgi:hypothetical protein